MNTSTSIHPVSFGAPSFGFPDRQAITQPTGELRLDRVLVEPQVLHLSAVSGLRANGSDLEESRVLDLIRERRALLWRIEPSGRVHWLFFDTTAGRPLVAIVGSEDATVIGIQPPRKSNRLTDLMFQTIKKLAKKSEPLSNDLDDRMVDLKQVIVFFGAIPGAPTCPPDAVTLWAKWSVAAGKLPENATYRQVVAAALARTPLFEDPVFHVVVANKKSGLPLLSQASSVNLIQR